MRWVVAALCVAIGTGCTGVEADFDGDGASDSSDCRPSDPTSFPGATDPWGDDIDQNCDGVDGLDFDEDGWASAATGGPDCDDTEAGVHPGATEIPDNDVDEDCDGEIVWCDLDGDGAVAIVCGGADCDDFDSLCRSEADCTDGDADGFVLCAGDCDEQDATVYPKAEELCDGLDNDCDGELPAVEADADGDGVSACAGDCDDDAASAYPGAEETCDGLDSDCDGVVPADEGDGDGDGDPACSDCDDADPNRGTNLPEACDGIDNDCDGVVLPGGAFGEVDNDADGAAECAGDCNDFDATIHPGATDGCDGVDTDCNGVVDDVNDLDGDGWCAGDCDDADPTVHPGQWDTPADGLDADCDGTENTDLGSGFIAITGTEAGEMCGYAVAGGADWDGDGVPDLVIGCPSWSGTSGGNPGRACIVPGGSVPTTGSIDLSAAAWCMDGVSTGSAQLFGSALAVGDIDGDGLDDLAIGSLSSPGDVAVMWGSTLATASGTTSVPTADLHIQPFSSDAFGSALALGDVDGDGLADLLVGEQDWDFDPGGGANTISRVGRAHLFLGADLAAASSPVGTGPSHLTVEGSETNSYVGRAVAIGDLDGDGLGEILIGASGLGVGGAASLWFGSELGLPGPRSVGSATFGLEASGGNSMLGQSVLLADVDGDGFADVTAGAPGMFTPSGGPLVGLLATSSGATLQPGTLDVASSPILHRGAAWYEYLGVSMGSGDVDADGAREVLTSGYPATACLPSQGSGADAIAKVVAGSSLAPGEAVIDDVALATFAAPDTDACLGTSFTGVGDLDGDGREDLALGAPAHRSSTEAGTVYILISPF